MSSNSSIGVVIEPPSGPVRFDMRPDLFPKRICIIGEAPSFRSTPLLPLVGGRSGRFVQDLVGLNMMGYIKTFRTYNLINSWPGKRWPLALAKLNAEIVLNDLGTCDRAIMLGRKVAEAFGIHVEFNSIIEIGKLQIISIPHPSGLNRYWNDKSNKEKTRQVLKEWRS